LFIQSNALASVHTIEGSS